MDEKKIDTIKDDTAMSTGNNIVKGSKPAGVISGQRLIYIRNEKYNGTIIVMHEDTIEKNIKTVMKKDLKDLDNLMENAIKNHNGKLLKIYESARDNIYNTTVCEYIPMKLDNGKYTYSSVELFKMKDLLGVN